MSKFRWFAASAIALFAVPLAAASSSGFSPERLSQHVQTLGSDAFEGRAPGHSRRDEDHRLSRPPIQRGRTRSPAVTWSRASASGPKPFRLLKSEFAGSPAASASISAESPSLLTQGEQIAVRPPTNGDKAINIDGAARLRRLRREGAGAQLGRFQGRRPEGQDHGRPRQRPRFREAAKAISAARR